MQVFPFPCILNLFFFWRSFPLWLFFKIQNDTFVLFRHLEWQDLLSAKSTLTINSLLFRINKLTFSIIWFPIYKKRHWRCFSSYMIKACILQLPVLKSWTNYWAGLPSLWLVTAFNKPLLNITYILINKTTLNMLDTFYLSKFLF